MRRPATSKPLSSPLNRMGIQSYIQSFGTRAQVTDPAQEAGEGIIMARKGLKIGKVYFMVEAKPEPSGAFVGVARELPQLSVCEKWRVSKAEAVSYGVSTAVDVVALLIQRLSARDQRQQRRAQRLAALTQPASGEIRGENRHSRKSALDLVPRRVAGLAATVSRELNIPFPQSAQREVRSYLLAAIEASNNGSNEQRWQHPGSTGR